jgi:hypothetical protein
MAQLKEKCAVQIGDTPPPIEMKQKVLTLQDDEQQDSDVNSDLDSVSSSLVSTSDNEEDTDRDFMGLGVSELRSIRNGVSKEDFAGVNITLHRLHPWIEGIDDASLEFLRIQLFQEIFRLCDWLDQKYNMEAINSYADISNLFKTYPQLVSDIDECWRNPERSFLPICNLGEYFWDNMRPI